LTKEVLVLMVSDQIMCVVGKVKLTKDKKEKDKIKIKKKKRKSDDLVSMSLFQTIEPVWVIK